MQVIKEDKKNFYTYTPEALRHHSMLLKGIDISYGEEDIKNALEEKQVSQYVVKVSKFSPRKPKNSLSNESDARDPGYWLLQLTPSTDLSLFANIKYLLHQAVSFEKFIRKETIQCRNCQRYGHAASNCGMSYRCVKCEGAHTPGQCLRVVEDKESEPYCVNCERFGHPASYRQCPKYQEILARKEQLKQRQEEERLTKNQMYSRFYTPGLSYSGAVAPKHTNSVRAPANDFRPLSGPPAPQGSAWDKTCNDMFGVGFTETLRKFYNFTPAFNAIPDPLQNKIALFEFFASLTNPQ